MLLPLAMWLMAGGAAWAAERIVVPQGGVGRYEMTVQSDTSAPWGSFRGERIPFVAVGAHRYLALIGVDMECPVGTYPFEVRVPSARGEKTVRKVKVVVRDGRFGVQRLTVSKEMAEPDAVSLERIGREKAVVGHIWDSGEQGALWRGGWSMPVEGQQLKSFGKRRLINNLPRNSHNGEDISAPLGTPVHAPNGGIVRLAQDLYFGGNSVFIDHGGGLFTFYMHLDEVDVKEGQTVQAGDVVGRVGKSGRATGPHLHWGGRLNNARINPLWLVRMNLAREFPTPPPNGRTADAAASGAHGGTAAPAK